LTNEKEERKANPITEAEYSEKQKSGNNFII